jgi:hypothetical protein
MSDCTHFFGSDLAFSPSGDLALVTGTVQGEQRVLRRLLSNPGAYIWQITYGAGLPGFVGQANPQARVRAVARQQMRREAAVAQSPAPSVTTVANTSGTLTLSISYVDAQTSGNVTLTVPVS